MHRWYVYGEQLQEYMGHRSDAPTGWHDERWARDSGGPIKECRESEKPTTKLSQSSSVPYYSEKKLFSNKMKFIWNKINVLFKKIADTRS